MSSTLSILAKALRSAGVDHLLAMKFHALRYGREGRKSKDTNDILDLAALHGIAVRSDRFRELCLRFGTPQLYDYLLKLAEPP